MYLCMLRSTVAVRLLDSGHASLLRNSCPGSEYIVSGDYCVMRYRMWESSSPKTIFQISRFPLPDACQRSSPRSLADTVVRTGRRSPLIPSCLPVSICLAVLRLPQPERALARLGACVQRFKFSEAGCCTQPVSDKIFCPQVPFSDAYFLELFPIFDLSRLVI